MSDSADTNNPADERRRIDPRFSPAFQPGYDPLTHRREPPSAPLREESSGGWDDGSVDGWAESSGAPAGAESRFAPSLAGSNTAASVVGAGNAVGALGVAGQRILAEQPDEDDEPAAWWRRINPWIIVLWVLGVAFIVGGIAFTYLLGGMTDPFGQNASSGYVISALFQMAMFGVPLLIVLGLATITASFVILAIRWRHP